MEGRIWVSGGGQPLSCFQKPLCLAIPGLLPTISQPLLVVSSDCLSALPRRRRLDGGET